MVTYGLINQFVYLLVASAFMEDTTRQRSLELDGKAKKVKIIEEK